MRGKGSPGLTFAAPLQSQGIAIPVAIIADLVKLIEAARGEPGKPDTAAATQLLSHLSSSREAMSACSEKDIAGLVSLLESENHDAR